MPRGAKSSYTSKQKRQAAHIEEGYRKRGTSKKTAEKRAWATVNKETGGGKKKSANFRIRSPDRFIYSNQASVLAGWSQKACS